jgi:hypothetical protein
MRNLINKNPTLSGIILCVLLAAFAGLLVKSGFDMKNENAHLREICTAETIATVVDYHQTGSRSVNDRNEVSDTRRSFPIYEYEAGGRIHTVRSVRYDSKGELRYRLGQKLTVRYVPGDPVKHYLTEEEGSADMAAWLCIGFGVSLLAFCGFGVFRLITAGGRRI